MEAVETTELVVEQEDTEHQVMVLPHYKVLHYL